MPAAAAVVEMLRSQQGFELPGVGRLYTPSAEGAAAIADALHSLLGDGDTITAGIQTGKLTAGQQRPTAWVGEMTWHLLSNGTTGRALIVIGLTATLDGQWITSVTSSKRWPLSELRRSEIEETRPRDWNNVSARVTLKFGDDVVTIDSTGVQPLRGSAELGGREQAVIAREFLAKILRGGTEGGS